MWSYYRYKIDCTVASSMHACRSRRILLFSHAMKELEILLVNHVLEWYGINLVFIQRLVDRVNRVRVLPADIEAGGVANSYPRYCMRWTVYVLFNVVTGSICVEVYNNTELNARPVLRSQYNTVQYHSAGIDGAAVQRTYIQYRSGMFQMIWFFICCSLIWGQRFRIPHYAGVKFNLYI